MEPAIVLPCSAGAEGAAAVAAGDSFFGGALVLKLGFCTGNARTARLYQRHIAAGMSVTEPKPQFPPWAGGTMPAAGAGKFFVSKFLWRVLRRDVEHTASAHGG